MTLPPLDLPTLFVVSALVIAFSGSVLMVVRGQDEGAVALVYWGSAMLVGAAGIVLLSLAPFTAWPAQAAGNVAILIGVSLAWTGARTFGGRQPKPLLALAGAAVWMCLYALPIAAATTICNVFGFVAGSAYTLAAAAELWRAREEKLSSRMPAIILLVVHAEVYLLEATGTAVSPDVFEAPAIICFLLLEAVLHTTAMAFMLLALMKERAERRSTLQLRRLAMIDGLTGLGNRRHFDELIESEVRRTAKAVAPMGLLMIDVDQFKAFNDTYGHQAGDDCLRSVATAIRAAVHRAGDLAMRYGGEEFAVLLPETNEAGALAVADEIHARIKALGISHSGSSHGVVTVSIGIAADVPGSGADQTGALVRAADLALYDAKASGRDMSRTARTVRAE